MSAQLSHRLQMLLESLQRVPCRGTLQSECRQKRCLRWKSKFNIYIRRLVRFGKLMNHQLWIQHTICNLQFTSRGRSWRLSSVETPRQQRALSPGESERMREVGRWNLAGALAMYTEEQYKLRTTFWIKQSLLNFLLLGCFETFETSQTLNSIEQRSQGLWLKGSELKGSDYHENGRVWVKSLLAQWWALNDYSSSVLEETVTKVAELFTASSLTLVRRPNLGLRGGWLRILF